MGLRIDGETSVSVMRTALILYDSCNIFPARSGQASVALRGYSASVRCMVAISGIKMPSYV